MSKINSTAVQIASANSPTQRICYLIESGGRYKIGKSAPGQSLTNRIRHIDTGSPFPVNLIHAVTHTQANNIEWMLHNEFKDKRVKGEWFQLDQEDVVHAISLMNYLSQLERIIP